jgi:hypothetical protein
MTEPAIEPIPEPPTRADRIRDIVDKVVAAILAVILP